MPEIASLIRFEGSDTLGIPLPDELLREHGLKLGDDVVLLPHSVDNRLTLYLPPSD